MFDETDALGRRRGAWTRAFWRWAESCRPSDPAAAAAFDRYVACVRCAESDTCSPKPKVPPAGSAVPAAVKRRCDDATARLRRRHESLGAAGKRPCVANVAVARELACWVWEVGRRAEGTLA